ncbi:MAG TPA: glycosyltransferase family 39 protein, partial [Dehalococcoidia bacterium]|nr:glycosyltransferase family 39 protein [Dehalococcoidia bacterium]
MQSSLESTGKSREPVQAWLVDQAVLNAAGLVLLVLLCLPVFTSQRAPINSDQSLYLSEALNIANGDGLTYTNGEPITHRAPVQPALIAGAFELKGVSLDSAYLVPRFSILANVLLLFFLGRVLFGGWGGLIAGVAAASSLYLRGLGTTLYLDSTQATFLLAALLVYSQAGASMVRMGGAGALLGVSFLIKEASLLFLPLPVVLALLYGFDDAWKRALPAWFAGFAAATAWWFVWVYAHTGDVYLAGQLGGALGLMITTVAIAVAVTGLAVLRYAPARFSSNRWTQAGAALVLVVWCALFLHSLESSAWQFEND